MPLLSPELQRYRISMLTKQMLRSDPTSISLSVDGKVIFKEVDDLLQYEYALSGGFLPLAIMKAMPVLTKEWIKWLRLSTPERTTSILTPTMRCDTPLKVTAQTG